MAEPGGETFVSKFEKPKDKVLDLTKDNLISEQDLIERIRRLFDEAELPTVIRVNSKQLLEILDHSRRYDGSGTYGSPFADHTVQVIPAKDIR